MNKYLKNLINVLYNNYDYNLVELDNIKGLCIDWGLVRKENNNLSVVLFFTPESINDFEINSVISTICSMFECEKENIIFTYVFVDSDYKNFYTESYESYPQCGLILINNVDNKIIYFSEGNEKRVQEFANSMYYIDANKNNSFKPKKSIITCILISVNILVYFLTAYMSRSILSSDTNVLIELGAKVNNLISAGEYYRLVTCMFLHGGLLHIGFNMYALYALGPMVESYYEKGRYLTIYFVSGIMGSIFSYTFSSSISVGASGAIFGLLGAALIMGHKMKNKVGKQFVVNILSVIAINLVMGFSIPNVDNFGHLGGLIGGILVSYFIK